MIETATATAFAVPGGAYGGGYSGGGGRYGGGQKRTPPAADSANPKAPGPGPGEVQQQFSIGRAVARRVVGPGGKTIQQLR